MSNREFLASLLEQEKDRFARVLAAVPAGKLDWRPQEKSRTAAELIGHLIGHDQDLVELAETGTINHRIQVPFDGLAEGLKLFAESRDAAVNAVKAATDAEWTSPGRFLVNGNLVYELPRLQLAWILFLDAIHHRGQLSTYLRPMGGACPSIYGPSADTQSA
jgi:uncharacterized damage-inducible protein DinB